MRMRRRGYGGKSRSRSRSRGQTSWLYYYLSGSERYQRGPWTPLHSSVHAPRDHRLWSHNPVFPLAACRRLDLSSLYSTVTSSGPSCLSPSFAPPIQPRPFILFALSSYQNHSLSACFMLPSRNSLRKSNQLHFILTLPSPSFIWLASPNVTPRLPPPSPHPVPVSLPPSPPLLLLLGP